MRLSIGELLLKERLITPPQLQEALDHHERHGGTLGRAFVTLGFVKDRDIASLLSVHCCVPTIDIEGFEVNAETARIISVETARKYQALPLARFGATLAIAVADPTNACALEDINLLTGCNLEPFVASESALEDAIERCYGADLYSLVDTDLDAPQDPGPQGRGDGAAARIQSERTAWAYVTAMHAAAVGGPRAPIRGIVEDVEDMREQLIRERDVARARVAALERQLERRKPADPGGTATAVIERSRTPSAEEREFIEEHLAEGRVYNRYGFVDKARAQFETVLERFPDNPEALGELHELRGEKRDDEAAVQRLRAMAEAPPETKVPAKARITLGELLMNENMVSLDQCLDALRHQKLNGGSLSAAFVRLGLVKDEEILSLLSRTYRVPSIRLEHFQPHPALIDIIPPETARKHRVLPLAAATTLTIAVTDPANRLSIDAIGAMTGCKVEPVVASESALDRAIDRFYGPIRSPGGEVRASALRLAWSRRDESRGDGGGPVGGLPAA